MDEFVGPYVAANLKLDPDEVMFVNPLTMSNDYTELKYQHNVGMANSEPVLEEVLEEFGKKFGRTYHRAEFYRCEDAEEVVVTMGSMSGTAVYTVDQMRAEGHKVGAVKIVFSGRFPIRLLQERLSHVPRIAVLERATSIGSAGGPVLCQVRSALANVPVAISGFVAGLGGRDITPTTFRKVFDLLRTAAPETLPTWVDAGRMP